MTILPGEELIVYCDNYSPAQALRHLQAKFNLSATETLYLIHTDPNTKISTVLDEIYLPKLHDGSLYQRDLYDRKFYERLVEERH